MNHYEGYVPFTCTCNSEGKCAGPCDACHANECLACGERDCPHGEPLHYHHDSCPACVFDQYEKEMTDEVIPEIIRSVKKRAALADDARRRHL